MIPIFGKNIYTVAELEDLLAAKKHNLDATENSYTLNSNIVNAKDPSWKSDWDALQTRWTAAKKRAETAIIVAGAQILTPNNMIPANNEYQAVLNALRQSPNKTTKSDLLDLSFRLTKAGVKPELSGVPQPRVSSDIGFNLFTTFDSVGTAILESPIGSTVRMLLPDGLVPGNVAADKADPTKHPVEHASFWLVGIIGALVAYFLAKNVAAPVARSYLAPMGGFAGATRAATERAQDALARRLDIQPPSRSFERQEIISSTSQEK